MKWTYLPTQNLPAGAFGAPPVILKVARFTGPGDVRAFHRKGWKARVDLLDVDPRDGRKLPSSTWFVFLAR